MSNIVPFEEKVKLAEAFAKSKLFGITDANQVLSLMAVCEAEGIHPAKAVQEYHVIQGRPALKADAMLARFQNAGGKVDWTEYTDERVTGLFTHPHGGSLSVTWTLEQASRIGLVKPGSGWQKFPRAMLRSRCISEGIRSVFPGSVTGFYSPEEVQDFEEKPQIRDITPKETPTIVMQGSDPVVITEKIPTGTLPLYIPSQPEPYANYLTVEDWIEGFLEMVRKLKASEKLTAEEKSEKYDNLKIVNQDYMSGWDGMTTSLLLRGINRLNKEFPNG